MSGHGKCVSFDTDYGVVGMSVNPIVSEKDFDFGKTSPDDDMECGSTFDFASKTFVKAALKSKIGELVEKIDSLEKRLAFLESSAKKSK